MDDTKYVSLYSNADRIVAVGERGDGQRLYKVSSLTMSMASPIWKAMFDTASGFRESNPDALVKFPEDDPDIMYIVLRIIHLKFDDIPESISFDWLVELAVFCDKYNTVNIVRPFIAHWAAPWTEFCLEPGYEQWLLVAWTFGCHQIFNTLAASLILSTMADNSDGGQDKTGSSNDWIHDEKMPADIVASILKVREDTIGKLLDLFHDITKSLMGGDFCTETDNDMHNRDLCNDSILSCFLRPLYNMGIGLGPKKICAAEVRPSISSLVGPLSFSTYRRSIRLLKLSSYQVSRHLDNSTARKAFMPCDLDAVLKPKVSNILENIPSVVTELYMRHMEKQAKKSGIGHLKAPEAMTEENSLDD